MKKQIRFFCYTLIVVFAVLLSGCEFFFKHADSFYNDTGGWDAARFPLLKPYELIYLDDEDGWMLTLRTNPASDNDPYYYYTTLHLIDKLEVVNGLIMVHTPHAEEVDESMGQKVLYWFVLIPDQNKEIGFENEKEFLSYIQMLGIQKLNWEKPSDAYQQFFETGCLNWIPDCKR
jgi:hypothetical protein